MANFNVNVVYPSAAPDVMTKRVWFEGDGAVKKGQAVVYDFGSTVTSISKDRIVNTPSSTLKYNFAGVTIDASPAVTGGQWITIAVPGSVVPCLVGIAGTAGSTKAVFAQNGLFGKRSSTTIEITGGTAASITSQQEEGCGTVLMLEGASTATQAGALKLCKICEGNECVAPEYSYQ